MSHPEAPAGPALRILHLCLACFYIDGCSYQENLLPRYHQRAGHEVQIIASLVTFDSSGEVCLLPRAETYRNEDGMTVTRLDYWPGRSAARLRVYRGLTAAIERAAPDVIFAHGPQFLDAWRVVRHVRRHPGVRLFVDNHADHGNSARSRVSRLVLHQLLWRASARVLARTADRMFGVLPARVDFLTEVYKVPREKVAYLPLGADDDLLQGVTPETTAAFRQRHGVAPEDLLVVTGGKIDPSKRATLDLMRAVHSLRGRRVRLIVFGTVVPALRAEFESLVDQERVTFLGWLDDLQSTLCFGAADVVVFPGHHSVFWEQVCAIGTPLVVTRADAKAHLDLGGNCGYLASNSEEDIEEALRVLLDQPEVLTAMTAAAASPERHRFSYRAIAEQSIGRDPR